MKLLPISLRNSWAWLTAVLASSETGAEVVSTCAREVGTAFFTGFGQMDFIAH
jgi:hypothetical protein